MLSRALKGARLRAAINKPLSAHTLRHWHATEDEFVWVLSGEVVLIEDEGDPELFHLLDEWTREELSS